ncbi:hypothetical protein C8P64_1131 [Christiangramia gaetbulicola]|uniref:Uncharacterized protein n=2 Tax=Christiangramia gaetbulicola TaxID=703340 RepID=A0A2T6AMU6_9FLAO|nr:hypothetical protein C8P64_1131 [Christiangramia gaetbulicola]
MVVLIIKPTMKIALFFLVLFHSVLIGNQDPVPSKYNVQEATLCQGDNLVLGDKEIKFKEIISDSRCPKRVSCIWAGEVKVLVEFYQDGKFKGEKVITGSNYSAGNASVTASTDISIAEFFKNSEFVIKKVVVMPYPEAGYKIGEEEYSLQLMVSQALKK